MIKYKKTIIKYFKTYHQFQNKNLYLSEYLFNNLIQRHILENVDFQNLKQ